MKVNILNDPIDIEYILETMFSIIELTILQYNCLEWMMR